jgi:hypothetical protein
VPHSTATRWRLRPGGVDRFIGGNFCGFTDIDLESLLIRPRVLLVEWCEHWNKGRTQLAGRLFHDLKPLEAWGLFIPLPPEYVNKITNFLLSLSLRLLNIHLFCLTSVFEFFGGKLIYGGGIRSDSFRVDVMRSRFPHFYWKRKSLGETITSQVPLGGTLMVWNLLFFNFFDGCRADAGAICVIAEPAAVL